LAGEIHWTNNALSIYAGAKASLDPNVSVDDMDHAYWPIGPVGKPTELHVIFPILAMNHTNTSSSAGS
jgi:multiple sugar transport system substrate-binding protein